VCFLIFEKFLGKKPFEKVFEKTFACLSLFGVLHNNYGEVPAFTHRSHDVSPSDKWLWETAIYDLSISEVLCWASLFLVSLVLWLYFEVKLHTPE
jgi:hypothetical protein